MKYPPHLTDSVRIFSKRALSQLLRQNVIIRLDWSGCQECCRLSNDKSTRIMDKELCPGIWMYVMT